MQSQSKQWKWMDCNLTIKRANKKNQNLVFQILQSQYFVQLQEDDAEAELNIDISMDKKVNYQEEAGFIWHKSWNIPTIEVKISKRDLNAIKGQLGINRVYCEITSGYPIRKIVEFYLQEVLIEGETRKEIGNNGVAKFNNLKFSQTSFNHQRNKFSLIVIIFTKNEERSRSVLKSFISMPIYVDSRRQARKKPPNNSFLSQLIPVDAFQQQLEQRHTDKKMAKTKSKSVKGEGGEVDRSQGKYVIRYSLGGFINYYKSANIRNKIKHPFYFSFHFSPLVTLYFNRQLAGTPLEVLKLMEKPCKHDAKKLLMVSLGPGEGEDNKDILEDLKKQFQNLFENSWKYYFIDLSIRGSPMHSYMLQEKALLDPIQDIRKWIEISRLQLLEVYSLYYAQLENRQNEQIKNSLYSDSPQLQQDHSQQNNIKRYEHFQLHQTIFIQSAFRQSDSVKRVKLEPSNEDLE